MYEPTDQHESAEGLEVIDEVECWRLLETQQVGRIAVDVGHYPVVYPVNYSLAAHGIVFRSSSGSKLWATERSNVGFEVDDFDLEHKTGWSVLIRGSARELSPAATNSELYDQVDAAAPHPWPAGTRDHLVRIVADSISGRRIAAPEGDRTGS